MTSRIVGRSSLVVLCGARGVATRRPLRSHRTFSRLLRPPISPVAMAAFSRSTHDDSPTTPYQSAIMHLNSLQSNAMTLQKMREKRDLIQEGNVAQTAEFLRMAGVELDDVDRLNVIYVSGTKGKGSTCAFVESILRHCGYKTGLYSSPHLVHARERIRIDSAPIDEEMFAVHFFAVYDKLRSYGDAATMPAYFKFLTLMAFHVFAAQKIDVAVVEVGIGGEYDCTNVIRTPIVCGVSTLDIDHTSILGSTLPEIAWHKAGIFKHGVPAMYSPTTDDALSVIELRAKEKEVPLRSCPPFESYGWSRTISAGIAGEHQKTNITLALQLVRLWLRRTGREASVFPDCGENSWKAGQPYDVPEIFLTAIENCRWPGRSQIVDSGNIRFFLDGAHTPKSMEMCSLWFDSEMRRSNSSGRKRVLVFQCTADRNPATLLPYLKSDSFDVALFCPTVLSLSQDSKSDLSNYNASTIEQLSRSRLCAETWTQLGGAHTEIFDCVTSLVKWVESKESEGPMDVLVTGSLHLVGAVLSIIKPDFE